MEYLGGTGQGMNHMLYKIKNSIILVMPTVAIALDFQSGIMAQTFQLTGCKAISGSVLRYDRKNFYTFTQYGNMKHSCNVNNLIGFCSEWVLLQAVCHYLDQALNQQLGCGIG